MQRAAIVVLAFAASAVAGTQCSPHDHPDDCAALVALAHATSYQGWQSRAGWLQVGSVCGWYGVKCVDDVTQGSRRRKKGGSGSKRVKELTLKAQF